MNLEKAYTDSDHEEVQRKYSIINDSTRVIVPVSERYRIQVEVHPEDRDSKKGIYNTHGIWAMGEIDLNRWIAKIRISYKAMTSLSDKAFRGLFYHEAVELGANLASDLEPESGLINVIQGRPYSSVEAFVDMLVHNTWNKQVVIPFRTETSNIGYRDGKLSPVFIKGYLEQLYEFNPYLARRIEKGLDANLLEEIVMLRTNGSI